MDNIKNEGSDDIITSFKIDTKQVINKNSIFSASGLFTNSISTTRSINEDPITFEDIYLRFENYNFFTKDDYLKTELSSVESFESSNLNSIPISPSISYMNSLSFKNYSSINELDFIILKRDESSNSNPSESFKIKLNNELYNFISNKNLLTQNKLYLSNQFNEFYFNKDKSLNHNSFKSTAVVSSDLNFNNFRNMSPRIKFIFPMQLENEDKRINEESESITFNYQNQFSENRFFGNDLFDSSPRVIYGIENYFYLENKELNFKINQSYDVNLNNNYANKINQSSKFSDYSIESQLIANEFSFKIDARLDQKIYQKKK